MLSWDLSYLIGDHDQRVFVLREKIKEAPESESVPFWDNAAAGFVRSVVFLCCKSPTQLIYVFLNKGAFDHLRDIQQEFLQNKKTNENKDNKSSELHVNHLVQDVFVEVRHVALTGHWAIIVIPEVLLQSHRIVRNAQDRAQVVGQDLERSTSLMLSWWFHPVSTFSCLFRWRSLDKHSH